MVHNIQKTFWTDAESETLLRLYAINMPLVGPMKRYKNKKQDVGACVIADGTFKTVPKSIYHLYTIHGSSGNSPHIST